MPYVVYVSGVSDWIGDKNNDTTTSMSSGKVSLHDMEMLVQRLLNQQHRSSTINTYLRVW